jgi:hypothetical protein
MESKQRNFTLPLFSHAEFDALVRGLRATGTKPKEGDLVAALIHAASASVDDTRAKLEAFVIYELAQEEAE